MKEQREVRDPADPEMGVSTPEIEMCGVCPPADSLKGATIALTSDCSVVATGCRSSVSHER